MNDDLIILLGYLALAIVMAVDAVERVWARCWSLVKYGAT